MTDLNKLLDGTVEDVKGRLAGLDAASLAALLAAEQAAKNRKGVVDAIEEAHTAASAGGVTYTSTTHRGDPTPAVTTANIGNGAVIATGAAIDTSPPANIAPADTFDPAGAPVQPATIDLDHVSLDRNPRANTTVDQNRIDFNDPVRTGSEIVTDQLASKQG